MPLYVAFQCSGVISKPAYMFEHPEETRKSIIGQAVNADRKTVGKYYDEIRTEIDSTLYKD